MISHKACTVVGAVLGAALGQWLGGSGWGVAGVFLGGIVGFGASLLRYIGIGAG